MALHPYSTQGVPAVGGGLPGLPGRVTPTGVPNTAITVVNPWVRNPDWIPMPTLPTTDSRFIGICAIYPESNFMGLSATGSLGYSVFWGDSNRTCTFTDVGDVVNATAHGLTDGKITVFPSIATTTGITIQTPYYIVNSTTDTFQVSLTLGGPVIVLTNDGTGTYRVYDIACTFTDSTDLVNAVAHGFSNNDIVLFPTINNTTGISIQTPYFIINANVDDFQISLTSGGPAISLTTDGTGTYSIPEKVATTVQANHQWHYPIIDPTLSTVGLVTFTDSGDLVTKINHGRSDNDIIRFYSITSTTGISVGVDYYVVNATTDTYQLSATFSGSPLTLTTDGVGQTLEYKQVCVTIVPQNAGTFTAIDLSKKHTQTLLSFQSSGMLDMTLGSPTLTSIITHLAAGQFHASCERFQLISVGAITSLGNMFGNNAGTNLPFPKLKNVFICDQPSTCTSFSQMFQGCVSLQVAPMFAMTCTNGSTNSMFRGCTSLVSVPMYDLTRIGQFGLMFQGCTSLTTVPLFPFGAISSSGMPQMFADCTSLTSVPLFNWSRLTNGQVSNLFQNCTSLTTVPLFDTSTWLSFDQMFNGCTSLTSVPLFNTKSATGLGFVFQNCTSLTTVPAFNTSSATFMISMFSGCTSLTSVPLFNTATVTDFTSMFQNCTKLKTVPLFNTAAALNMTSMFNGCKSLTTVPLFNTATVTNMTSMFSGCISLTTIPLFNTSIVTNMSLMFNNCSALPTIPLFNTPVVTDMSSMFAGCASLTSVPLLNTISVTTTASMFSLTAPVLGALNSLPFFNLTNTTTLGSMLSGRTSLSNAVFSNIRAAISFNGLKLSTSTINSILDNLKNNTAGSPVISFTSNWGSITPISTAAVGTTAGSTTATMASTTGLVVGMEITGTNIAGTTTGRAVTFTDAGDLVGLTAHGFPNGTQVSFLTIVTTTGLTTKTIYYVVNANANDFQVSLTPGGSAIVLTTNGTGTVIYPNTIVSIIPNTSIVMSIPAIATLASQVMTSTIIRRSAGHMRGFSVTG